MASYEPAGRQSKHAARSQAVFREFHRRSLVLLITFSLVLTMVAGEMVDRIARPSRRLLSGGPVAIACRTAVILSIWLSAFGLTGRPLFAFTATAVTIGIIVTISNVKLRYLREPLLFSDFALLEHLLQHPQLFYIPRRWQNAALVGVLALFAAIAVWMMIEPRVVGARAQAFALAMAAIVPAAIMLQPSLLASAGRLVRDPKPHADVAHIGMLATLLAYTVAWRLEPLSRPRQAPAMNLRALASHDAVIVIQAESFVDLRRLGQSDVRLPAFDRLKQRAIASGLIEVACEGAYTLRPESAVITGLGYDDQGFDRFHPYLRPRHLSAGALPRQLAEAGWDTLFVHPHDHRFFRRAQAMPALGFARCADERAFAGARHVGPYVCDDAVAQLLLAEIDARAAGSRPLFVYAVTMEAHDPYGPGRLPGEDDPVRQYIHHLENADRMLARVADTLDHDDRRVLLVFFGDHVPFLPEFADPFPDTRTDYLAVELGPNARRQRIAQSISRPEHLHALIAACLEGSASARISSAAG